MASTMAWVSGVTAICIVFAGYLTCLGLLSRVRKGEDKFLIWEALILFCLGTFYLGTVVSFLLLLFTGYNIEPGYVGAQLCYTIAPIGSAICMYAGFTMLGKNKIAKPMTIIHLLTGIIYWYGLFFEPNLTIGAVPPIEVGGGLIDFELKSYVKLLTAVYLGFLIIVIGGGFFWFGKQSTGVVRKRSMYIGTGACFFAISGAIDSLVPLEYFIVIPRFFMITGAILLYMGFLRGANNIKERAPSKVAIRQEATREQRTLIKEEKVVEMGTETFTPLPKMPKAMVDDRVTLRSKEELEGPQFWIPPESSQTLGEKESQEKAKKKQVDVELVS